MTDTEQLSAQRVSHVVALVAGLVAILAFYVIPSGVVGYLVVIAVSVVAIVIGHRSVSRRGPLLWMAILGLILAYLGLVVSVGVLVVRLMRMFVG
ncbi:hypothetical protein ACTU6U_02510 [Microbacterium sp. A196]|uniref:hypothetical protein n=1 Tax=unclassified Microbacterium TaxID=2609290 RepID=UPI003FD3124C